MERQGADAMAVRLGAYDSSQHAQLDGFKSRGLRMAAPAQRHLYATEWRPLAASEATPVAVVVLSSACPFSSRAGQTQLSERLHADTLAALAIVVSTQHIAFERQALVKFEGALALVQRQSSTEPAPTVWLLTDSLGTAVQSAGLWGFARSVRMEASLPLQCTEAALTMAISYGSLDAEPDTVHQRESHLVPRLQTASPSIEGLARLHFHARGAISNLFIEQQAPVKRSEDELLLRVHAVGLNFRDVLNVLGEYPGDPGPPGGDSAGIVQEGALLNYFTPPAETAAAFGIGLAPLACLALAPATLLARKPVSLTFEQASTLPITWSTTHVALERAGLYAGHNIVVQAAAGGVGLKAIEYAQWLSAASLGTAGRPHKHAQLVEAGVKALGSSRSGDTFTYGAALLLCAARSRVVLNSLSLDFIAASFILLGEGAAFQEIGKRSIWASSRHAASSPATGYCAIALDLDIANDPLWWNRMLALLGSRSDAAAASSLPLRSFDMEKQHELGFRTLQSGLNTGKIVMRIATRVVAVGGGHAVTGGTSGIGLLTGRWLGQRGAHHLVLASRSGRFGRDAHSGMELPKTTKVEQCDTGDVSHVHRLMSACSSPSRPLLGIWHAAGVIADAVLSKQDALALVRTYAPKAYGAWSLQAASAAAGLHTFALFSSVAGLFGGAGQANYSAANVCLDALASHRRTRSAAAVSVQWGAWADVGMATRGAASERMAAMEAASGFARIEPAQGLRALATAVRPGAPWVMSFVPVTWSRTRSDGAATPAFLSAFAPKTREAVAVRDGGASSASCVLSLESVLEMVQRTAGGAVDADAPLMESGVDSLGAVELRNQLQTAAGSSLPSTLVFDHPTARQLGLLLEPKQAPPSTSPSTSPSRMGTAFRTGAGVCVDGASALISAGASSPLMASHMMACSSNTITEVPAARWFVGAQPALAEPMASRVRHGGFVLDAHLVDSAAFGIVPAEAAAMDPCQRLLLERGYEALHDANLGRLALGGSLTGVFLGFAGSEFGATLAASPAGGSVYAATGASVSIASGRISYALGLNGPCVTYDTACSAALSASHAALCALQLGACDTGLVVGVSLMFAPAIGTAFAVAGMTSAQGRSHTFDARADGYARGEACGGVALRDDGEGHSVSLLGAVVRQDGRSASLTAPNGQSQQDLIVATLADASTSIDSLGQNEAHGTGTILGDPIEAGSLTAAVLKFRAAPLAVGGVKANIGHAEPAAGMTGLLKLSFGLRRGEAAPNAQLRSLNPLLGLSHDGVPCVLPVQLVVPRATQSTGGVSSFGYSGTIVHAVLCSSTVAHTISTIMAPLAFHRHAFSWREQSRAAPSTPRSRIGSQSCATRVPSLHEVLEIAQLTAGTQVDADAPLMDAGLDSHGAVELRNLLHSAAGGAIALPDTLVFDFPTSRKLLNFFLDRSQSCATRVPSLHEVLEIAQLTAGTQVDADAPLMDAGLDSHGAVELRNLLHSAAGGAIALPDTLVFDFPTSRKLLNFFLDRSQPDLTALMPLMDAKAVTLAGRSASLPHGVASPGAAYCMSEGGVDTISEVPLQRWSTEGLPKVSEPIASRRRHGGFLEGAELFDNKCFLIPPREVAAMDPQQRCVLEHGYSALHEVGFDKSSLEGSVTGVFIGIQALEFPELLAKLPAGGGVYSATGSAHAIVCGRVSFVLGLQGACAAYDSACSSGLVATHAALSALTLNECASGLAIGINLMLLPALCLGCATAGMTSALGRCHTFDGRADGYARSEACSAHTLQQGSDGALQASLELCGGAVRQDGKSASLTAPNGQAQQALRLAVRARAGNFTHRSRFVEAHGTGTALGDPIEAGSHAAVASTLGEGVDALGSVKANLGHSEPGAGSSGLLMLTLQLGQSQATANAQLRVLNPRVRTALGECISVLHVQGEAAFDSASGSVSSFGYGGTIAHLAVVRSSAQTTVSTPAMRFFRRRGFRWREFPRRTRASTHSTSVTARSQPVAARSQSVAAEEENESRMLVQGFYDAATVDHNTPLESQFLTFGPFREIVPGFNWLHAFSAKPGTVVRQLLEASQICMRKLLYRHVDWERTQRVFDFGCGQGVDLCILARDHPHLVGDGFTLSPEQAAKARANAAAHGLDGRVNAYVNNSARDPLPSKYELVQGFEVAHHIPLDEKAALFRNCGNGMRDGGHIVMADFIVNGMGTIDNDNISSYFIGVAEWAKYLGEAGLAVTDVVDISVEVSNFLHVVDFGDEFGVDEFGNNTVNDTFSSYNGLGRALRAGLTSYVLIDAQKVRGGSVAERIKANEVALTNLVPFQTVEFAEYKRDWPRWLPVVAFATEWVPLPKPIGTTSSALLLSAPRLGLAGRVGGPSSGALPMGAGADGILLLTEGCTVDLSTVCSCLALLQGVALAASKPAITLLGLRAGKTQGHRQTGTVGLARGLRVEDPSLELFCVCAEPQLAGSVHKHAVQASCAVSVRDPDVLLGSSGVSIPRLKVRQLLDGPADKQAIDGSHVVTGGTSGLGLVLARWLGVSCDAKSVLLASRTGVLSVGAERAMSESGVETSTSRCNVAEATDLSATLIQALSKPAPHSLWHCAGMLEDAVLAHQAAQKLQNVYAPKAAGASGLHRLAAKLHVRTAVFYSSVVVVLGGPGQSNYAAVNESLDLLVAARRSSALAAHSPQWGAWGEVGMASRLSAKQLGAMGQLQPEEGMAALQGLMQRGSGSGSELILRFSFGVFMKSVPALLEKLIPSQSCGRSAAAVVGSQAKIGLPVVLQLLESIAVSAIDADAPLQEAGLDSLGSIDLRNQLQELVGDSRPALPSTLIFEHPTARQVALLLSPSVADSEPGPVSSKRRGARRTRASAHSTSVTARSQPVAARSQSVAAEEENESRMLVQGFYDAATVDHNTPLESQFLTFGPFREIVPGFNWLHAFSAKPGTVVRQLLEASQICMRKLLYRHVDWERTQRVFDFGCGQGVDLCILARDHPHLVGDGFTLSPEQAAKARANAAAHGLDGRVNAYVNNSARDPLPSKYELVQGFEVAHHIPLDEKAALFRNCGNGMRDGGHIVMADFIVNGMGTIDNDNISSYFIGVAEWAKYLGEAGLAVTDVVDISVEVSNFLHVVDFGDEFGVDEFGNNTVNDTFSSYNGLGRALRAGLTSYVLIDAQKVRGGSVAERIKANEVALTNLVPFQTVEFAEYKRDWPRWLPVVAFATEWVPLPKPIGTTSSALLLSAPRLGLAGRVGGPSSGALPMGAGADGILLLTEGCTVDLSTVCSCLALLQGVALAASKPAITLLGLRAGKTQGHRQTGTVGLARGLRVEDPSLELFCVCAEPQLAGSVHKHAVQASCAVSVRDPDVLLGSSGVSIPRLKVRQLLDGPADKQAIDGSHVVTGGTSGLGLVLARWLGVSCDAKSVLLASRTGVLSVGAERAMSESGVETSTSRCNVAEATDLSATLIQALSKPAPHSLWHCAGMLEDAVLAHQAAQKLQNVYAPKAAGASGLHRLAAKLHVRTAVFYSSVVVVLGGPGQSNYAAVNESLDLLVAARRSSALAAHSPQWGAWGEVGMASRLSAKQLGAMGQLQPEEGMAALQGLMQRGSGSGSELILRFSFGVFMKSVPALLEKLIPSQSCGRSAAAVVGSQAKIGLPVVLQLLESIAVSAIDADAPLQEAGLDSLGSIDLRNQLQELVGDSRPALPSTLIFEHPTARQVALLLSPSVADSEVDSGLQPPDIPLPRPSLSSFPFRTEGAAVQVIGCSSCAPAGASSPAALAATVSRAVNAVSEVPATRWTITDLSDPSAIRANHGGFMKDLELFDGVRFAVLAAESAVMDPQQRQLLERGYEMLHASGFDRVSLIDSEIAVSIGIVHTEMARVLMHSRNVFATTSSALSIAAGRLPYVLGLHGPCAALETACSAAVVATHFAMRALQHGECEVALAAGVNSMLIPATSLGAASAGMTSARGRSHTFDSRADGYVRSEACGGFTLEYSDSEDELAILGSAVRQDGRTASLTAPNGKAQRGLLVAALSDSHMSAMDLGLHETHGTGTALGDPIETGSLVAAVLSSRDLPLAVVGVKANLGHAEPAAGMTGLLKMALGLQRGDAAPNAQLRVLNPHVGNALQSVECALPVQLVSSMADVYRQGGVSSFGYSGTIANEVMQFVSAEELLSPISAPLTYRRRVYPWCEACAATEVKRVGIYAAVWAAAPVTAASSSSLLLMGASCSCCFTHAQVLTAHPWGFVTVLLAGSKSTAPSLSGIHLALSSVQQLLGLSRPPRLLVLTGGALAANDKHDAHNSAHGGAWGFGRVVNLEQPPLRAQIADVAACASVAATAALAANGAETELMWSGEMRHVARLRACSASSACHSTLSRGTYAITGGLGGLGLRAATLLVDGGASRVLIASRSGRVAHGGQGLEAQLESLAEAGWMIACDSASMCDTGALLRADLPAGVLHAAGAADKGLLNELAVQRVYWLSASKSLGAWYVHCAAVNGPLEVQILFSSVGSGLGNVGQANYAISNACLEARALSHQSNGMVACTLQWPIVGGAGMGAETFTALAQRQVAIVGLAGISLEEYAACLGAHLQACELALSVQIVHRSDIHALQQDLADATQPRFMELVMHAAATAAVASTSERTCKASGNAIAESLVPLAPSQRRVRVETAVLRVVRELTGAADAALTAETPLMDAGVDSLAATELSSRLRSLMGVALSPTIVFEQPSPRAVAVHLLEQMSVCAATTVEALPVTRIVDADAWMPLELSGMIGRWPGGCGEERARQELQVVCGDAVGRVPWTRWVLEEVVDVSTLSTAQDSCVRHGGFVAASQRFDARAFGISPAEVSAMDPQQRLLLELGYASLHGSSHRRVTLMGGDSGVLLGIERPDWALASPPAARSSIFAVTGDNVSAAAGRVSFVLGLQGPCSSVDTACSSALVAIHWGSHAVRGGGCADAMGLAVSLKLATFGTLGAAAAGMLSSDGRCKTLDASANGYVRSEGVGALVLRQRPGTLQLNGSAVRQDGRSASLTAPNGSAQRVLLHQALGIAMLTPQEVGFVEAHGTGTPLGDPTEAGALADVHGRSHLTRQLVVGAVKANVGHSESASGQVGMLKLRQLLNCLRVPGNAHLRVLNPLIGERMASGCFLLSMHDIVSNSCSAMSAFGFSGTIAHLALTANPAQATGEYISTALYNTTLFARHSFAWRSQLHPLAQFQSNLSDNAVTFRSPAAGALHALVANHVVGGRVVLPGAAYLEVARAAACSLPSARGAEARLRAVFFLEPLEVRGVHMECALVDGRFEVRSGTFVAPTLDAGSALNSSGEYDFRSSWKELDEPSVVRRCVVRARSNELSVEAAPSLPLPATIPRLPLTQTSHNRTLSPQLRMYARC